MHLKLRENLRIETMATDGTYLDYNPDFVLEQQEMELMSILIHEGYHCAWKHHLRMGDRDLEDWNSATDYYINFDMKKMMFKLPAWVLYDPKYEGMSSEEIYEALRQQKAKKPDGGGQQQQQPGQGQQQQGSSGGQQPDDKGQQPSSGNGSQPGGDDGAQGPSQAPDPGRMGGIVPVAPEWESNVLAAEEARWDSITRQAVNIALGQSAGKIPGFLERLVTELQQSKVDWRTIFRNFVDDNCEVKYSWLKPNKRYLWTGLILPDRVQDGTRHLVGFMDTSGSTVGKLVNQYGSEITAILDEGLADKVTVIYTDAKVQNVQEFERGDPVVLDAKGGGGTDFRDAFRYAAENCPDMSVVVFFTDLDTRHFGEDPGVPVLWTVYGSKAMFEQNSKKVPFGHAMHIE
jgi:predicted metal-dependent peptidase